MKTIRAFIDSEFTDFRNRDLISLGLVAETGETFYGENLDYFKLSCSDFVKQHVIPLCNFAKFGMRRAELSAKAWEWLNELNADKVDIIIDYTGDWELLMELFNHQKHPKLNKHPTNIFTPAAVSFQNHKNLAVLNALTGANEANYKLIAAEAQIIYNNEFDQYFIDTGEIQHHALSDAKANARGFNAMMEYIKNNLS